MDESHSLAEHIKRHVRLYWAVGFALLIGTIVTVGMYYVHFESTALAIAVALFIASVKASLVACFFMHLISEKTAIYVIMGATVFFSMALIALTILSYNDVPRLTG